MIFLRNIFDGCIETCGNSDETGLEFSKSTPTSKASKISLSPLRLYASDDEENDAVYLENSHKKSLTSLEHQGANVWISVFFYGASEDDLAILSNF